MSVVYLCSLLCHSPSLILTKFVLLRIVATEQINSLAYATTNFLKKLKPRRTKKNTVEESLRAKRYKVTMERNCLPSTDNGFADDESLWHVCMSRTKLFMKNSLSTGLSTTGRWRYFCKLFPEFFAKL